MKEISQKGDHMRLASIAIYVFFMSAVGLAAHNEIPANILYDDMNSLHGWDSPELVYLDCRNTRHAGTNSQFAIAGDYLFDDCSFTLQQTSVLTAQESGNKKWFDYFDNQSIKLSDTGYDTKYSRSEFSLISNDEDPKLANNPGPRINEYDKAIFWIKDAYRAWVSKDHSGSTRLLLLSFGLVGIIGIKKKAQKTLNNAYFRKINGIVLCHDNSWFIFSDTIKIFFCSFSDSLPILILSLKTVRVAL